MKLKRLLIITVLCFLLLPALKALAEVKLPEPQGHINDYGQVLSRENRANLELRLVELQKKTGDEVAVVIVDSLQGTTVEDYAVRLFEKWKIGKKGKDNGVLLLVALQDRKVRIEVGYGLESKLTDIQASKIIRDSITPAFQKGNFDSGVEAGVNNIVLTLAGKDFLPEGAVPQGASQKSSPTGGILAALSVLFFLGAGVVVWLISVLARSKSWWAGGVIGAVIGLVVLFFSGLLIGMLAIIGLTALGLALDFMVSKGYSENSDRGNTPPWWAGGMWAPGGGFGDFGGSSGGDGGGFGGFGGGESGGGGASGDW